MRDIAIKVNVMTKYRNKRRFARLLNTSHFASDACVHIQFVLKSIGKILNFHLKNKV